MRIYLRLATAILVLSWCGFLAIQSASGIQHQSGELAGDERAGDETAGEERTDEEPTDEVAALHFVKNVLPTFRQKCFVCHGDDPDDIRGEFDMRSKAGLLYGGESAEPSLVVNEPDESPLYLAATRESASWPEMPPKENDRLSEAQLEALKNWIRDGAVWPTDEKIAQIETELNSEWSNEDGIRAATSGGLADDWTNRRYLPENLWAYQPLEIDRLSEFAHNSPSVIDDLLARRHDALGVEPTGTADRRTLIRRATFDLIGLPPTPAEIDDFVNDERADEEAFSDVVDRLLNSPHYGEQWGRHWLDVARYADSSGFANDYERGNSWRYRDYVIRAFNDDKPYDQFIREQLAGDEMDASNSEFLIATGFLRMGPWELTGMEVAKVARQRYLDDVTDAVGQVFLAHMLQCARCHDHKFDPIPTRDYYSMQAFFATTQLAERAAPFLEVENQGGFDERKYLAERQRHYQRTIRELDAKRNVEAAREWYKENGFDATKFEEVVTRLESNQDNPASVNQVRTELEKLGFAPDEIPPRHVGFTPQEFGQERVSRKGLERLKWRFERYQPFALAVYDGLTPRKSSVSSPIRLPQNPMKRGDLEQTCILTGGDPFSPATPVAPNALSVVDNWNLDSIGNATTSTDSVTLDENEIPIAGRRMELANWIARADNPLTARVMVNRIWQWHFGQAIAGNPNNFGATGKKPTHPELLDYLAFQFLKNDWSIKSMHRLIMNTEAYRRSTQHEEMELVDKHDPNHEAYLVFHARRLDAEEIRDSMLTASGELNREVGGIPIRPEMNLEAALQPRQVMGTFAEAWQPSPLPEQRHRRSLYALRLRGQRDPFQEVFNAPSPDLSCESRDASTVTPQVFAMFNSASTFDRGLAMASRLLAETESRKDAIQLAFALCYGRLPTDEESEACLTHWTRMTQRHQSLKFEAPDYPSEVVREAVEENTGEKFTFREPLEVYADFVPDLKPYEASPEMRGLAEVCLVLMNSNEFVYVY